MGLIFGTRLSDRHLEGDGHLVFCVLAHFVSQISPTCYRMVIFAETRKFFHGITTEKAHIQFNIDAQALGNDWHCSCLITRAGAC